MVGKYLCQCNTPIYCCLSGYQEQPALAIPLVAVPLFQWQENHRTEQKQRIILIQFQHIRKIIRHTFTTLCTAWAYNKLTSTGSWLNSLFDLNSLFLKMNLFSPPVKPMFALRLPNVDKPEGAVAFCCILQKISIFVFLDQFGSFKN